MGHSTSHREHRLLQQRLDVSLTGAPDSPHLMKILQLLFTEEEAAIAHTIPGTPTRLDVIAQKTGIPSDVLGEKLTGMAQRGLIGDLELRGQRYFFLPPVVIGFFEFTFMRARDDLPMKELAELFDRYMETDCFASSVFQGQTQIGRTLVREESLPDEDHAEVLDWERASRIITEAPIIGVSICSCRHKAMHLGRACEAPQEVCLTFDFAARTLIRNNLAREIGRAEAMSILQRCKESGLAQIADNVQRKIGYMCNCCSCCCEMFQAIRKFGIGHAIVTSNWIACLDSTRCKKCGICTTACPTGAFRNADDGGVDCNSELCIGCGICVTVCKVGAVSMKARSRRVYTPETMFDRMVAMAIERNKLADMIFSDPSSLTHRAMRTIIARLEKLSPFQAAIATEPLKSGFFRFLVRKAKAASGTLREELE